MLEVTYLHHSGFLVETDHYFLLFDYYTQNGRHGLIDVVAYPEKQWLIFASHDHGDHFDPKIFSVAEQLNLAGIVLSDDINSTIDTKKEMLFVSSGRQYDFLGATIQTLRSNDEGVAFLVSVDGVTVYHGGDLNWWHWNGESKAFHDEIAESYKTEINKIKGIDIDVAFIAVDTRLEDKYIWGLDYFMKQVGAKWVFPMHFWRRYEICQEIQKDSLAKRYKEHVKCITKVNELFVLK